MNNVELQGRVLSARMSKRGGFIVKVAVVHEHNVNGTKINCESVFITIMTDPVKIKGVDLVAGQTVHITGHLKPEISVSATGNTRERMQVFADDIEVISYAK